MRAQLEAQIRVILALLDTLDHSDDLVAAGKFHNQSYSVLHELGIEMNKTIIELVALLPKENQ